MMKLSVKEDEDGELITKLVTLFNEERYTEYLEVLHSALLEVKTVECGEPLLSFDHLHKEIYVDLSDLKIKDIDTDRKLLRKEVIEKLSIVQERLPQGLHLLIRDAFRSKKIVEQLYDRYFAFAKEEDSSLTDKEADQKVRMFIAMPDDPVIPGHMTGGALDIILAYGDGTRVPMEISYDLVPRREQIKTYCKGLPEGIVANRMLLVEAMKEVGFHNYSGEYWHYSFGDAYHAVRKKEKIARYGIPEGL